MTIEHAPSTNGKVAHDARFRDDRVYEGPAEAPVARRRVRPARLVLPALLGIAMLALWRLMEQRAGTA